jgi:hypothetical protein
VRLTHDGDANAAESEGEGGGWGGSRSEKGVLGGRSSLVPARHDEREGEAGEGGVTLEGGDRQGGVGGVCGGHRKHVPARQVLVRDVLLYIDSSVTWIPLGVVPGALLVVRRLLVSPGAGSHLTCFAGTHVQRVTLRGAVWSREKARASMCALSLCQCI